MPTAVHKMARGSATPIIHGRVPRTVPALLDDMRGVLRGARRCRVPQKHRDIFDRHTAREQACRDGVPEHVGVA